MNGLLHHLQSPGRVELGQTVVGDDDVPILLRQRRPHLGGILHPFRLNFVAGLFEQTHNERGVALRIFDL